jgi:hypothetical protein
MRRNRKGSMELGVNSIVVLIIALALLGLGIGFITNLFKGGQGKLGSLIERADLPVHADSSNPIAFDSSDMTIKAGSSGKLVVSVYNSDLGDGEIGLDFLKCVDSTGAAYDYTYISIAAPPQTINLGTDGGYRAIINVAKDGVAKGTYICTLVAGSALEEGGIDTSSATVSQQLFINVVV